MIATISSSALGLTSTSSDGLGSASSVADRAMFKEALTKNSAADSIDGPFPTDITDVSRTDSASLGHWLDTAREKFSDSVKTLGDSVKSLGPTSALQVHDVLQIQLNVVKLSVQFQMMTQVGSKSMQNFETFLKNQS